MNRPDMRNGYTIIWSFRNRVEVFKESLKTAHLNTPLEVNFSLIDASSTQETLRELRSFVSTLQGRDVRITESAYRSNLGEAWNLGMMLSDTRYVIFSSSDVVFLKSDWILPLHQAALAGAEYVLLENHSIFLIDKKAVPKFGWFDEQFRLGPHFDVDYMIRCSEAGAKYLALPNHGYYSHGDDAETHNKRLNNEINDRLPMHDPWNEHYFRLKWESDWTGWEEVENKEGELPHPPTHITRVKRRLGETDPHPLYTSKFR